MFKKHDSCTHCSCTDQAVLALRLVLAVVLVMHGYSKLFGGVDGFAMGLDRMGFPLPLVMAWIVAILEFFGGIAIAVGLFTRYVAALVVVQFAIILLVVKKFAFPQSDVDLLVLGIALALALVGSGGLSADKMLMKSMSGKDTPAPSTPPSTM